MESLPKFRERAEERRDHNAFEYVKRDVESLCRQMKNRIENGEYDILVSDEAGGRIPTLIFREIFRQVRPKDRINALFVANGHQRDKGTMYFQNNADFQEYLRKGLQSHKRVLLVTQAISDGHSIKVLTRALREVGAELVDVATLASFSFKSDRQQQGRESLAQLPDHLYRGNASVTMTLLSDHEILSGVTKSPEPHPKPMRLDKAIETHHDRSQYVENSEYARYLGGEESDWWGTSERKSRAAAQINEQPLSDEDKAAIQQNINDTRKYIKDLATEVVKDVWPELALDAKQ